MTPTAMTAQEVIDGNATWAVEQADCLAWLNALPADSVDLCVFSPPYEAARTYGIDFKLRGQAWVDWMVEVFRACQRVCKGLVACVCAGQTRNYRWSATPALLLADLHRAGFNLRPPCWFHRVGIPGSGGPDWFRGDVEFIVCTTRPGRLPWSDNKACGHPPKWAPGGEISHRTASGERVNAREAMGFGGMPEGEPEAEAANRNGRRLERGNPKGSCKGRRVVRGSANGDTLTSDSYNPPAIVNPGTVIACKVGGGLMGHKLAHENEAPFPLGIPERFVRSCCPPNGIVLDPFSGSGTTGHAALAWGRRFIGCDVRESQVELTKRRLAGITPTMFLEAP